ncbi:MAG: gluconeogenesis factor YvcK family protein, partial [Angustibacter sp.]
RLVPANPPACPAAVAAINEADWVVLGPGSWYTSVMPHLLVPQLRDALYQTQARRCITLNLVPDAETGGMRPHQLLEALLRHAPQLRADVVLADPSLTTDGELLRQCAERLGARLVVAHVAQLHEAGVHDRLRLAAAYRDFLSVPR